jgi:hypothetical protein
MTTEGKRQKPKAVSRTIDDEIAAAEERLRRLKDQKRDAEQKAREKNAKAVLELLRTERLDQVQASIWEKELPKIRALLLGTAPGAAADPKPSGGRAGASGHASPPENAPVVEIDKAA